jgi:hypothetical protein
MISCPVISSEFRAKESAMKKLSILGLSLALAPLAHGEAIIHVRADRPANAYLDGHLVGRTPVKLSHLRSGIHVIKVEDRATGELKVFKVYSPKTVIAEKTIEANWAVIGANPPPPAGIPQAPLNGAAPAPGYGPQDMPPPPPGYPAPYGAPAAVPPPGCAAGQPGCDAGQPGTAYVRPETPEEIAEHERVRTRNVLLGAAAANELLVRGPAKGAIRAFTLGGALLNELSR